MTKYIFVTGGVLSGLGKGITAASLGAILKARNLKVNIQKCDPYFNVDAGTLNPAEHGEVFVTNDGAEADLDLGHYERFLDINLTQASSMMSGRIFRQVIEDERAGKYLGKTVQIIPHVTDAMQTAIINCGKGFDVHLVEVGGTVGDYESTAFIEAIRQIRSTVGANNVLYVHVVYLPFLETSQEIKSKPAQNAVRDLREAGINPDILVARADHPVPAGIIKKLSLFTDVPPDSVVPMPTAKTVYQVPLLLEDLGIGKIVCQKLGLPNKKPNLEPWSKLYKSIINKQSLPVKVGIVAKYLDHQDTYMSVIEALKSASWAHGRQLEYHWVDAEKLTDNNAPAILKEFNGIVVPGGFGSRGIEGKITAAKYALQNNLPYLGLCLGLQVAVIAAARISGLKEANSTEFDAKTPHPVIDLMSSQKQVIMLGGTMRLGNYDCQLSPGSKAYKLYKTGLIAERHRHRYEVNSKYIPILKQLNINVVGKNPQSDLVEVIEASNNDFFMASQFHPEFTSRPLKPHPLFYGFIAAAIKVK
jgi:CTP synthase